MSNSGFFKFLFYIRFFVTIINNNQLLKLKNLENINLFMSAKSSKEGGPNGQMKKVICVLCFGLLEMGKK